MRTLRGNPMLEVEPISHRACRMATSEVAEMSSSLKNVCRQYLESQSRWQRGEIYHNILWRLGL